MWWPKALNKLCLLEISRKYWSDYEVGRKFSYVSDRVSVVDVCEVGVTAAPRFGVLCML